MASVAQAARWRPPCCSGALRTASAFVQQEEKIDALRRLSPRLSTQELRSALTTAGNSLKFASLMLGKVDRGPAKDVALL